MKRSDTVERRGMGSHRHRIVERDGLTLVPPNGEGLKRPDTVDRRGIETSRHRRAKRDGFAPTPQSGEVWPKHRRPERDGLALVPPNGEGWSHPGVSEQRVILDTKTSRTNTLFCVIFIYNCCT